MDPSFLRWFYHTKLVRAHYDHVTDFLHFRIEPLGPREHLQNEVHWQLLVCCFAIWVTSFSVTRAPLRVQCVAETYKTRGCPSSGLDSVGNSSR
jgi:hypothetical protein